MADRMFGDAADGIRNAIGNVGANFGNARASGMYNTSAEFMSSNSIVARIAFVLLVLIAFVIAFRVGVNIVAWILSPANSPYIVYGMMDGTNAIVIDQDPTVSGSIPLPRSKNETTGQEFTWSVWLFFTQAPAVGQYVHIFNKGNQAIASNGSVNITSIQNDNVGGTNFLDSPGLYATTVQPDNKNYQQMQLVVNMASYNTNQMQQITVPDIPIRKWINVVIRLENMMLDVYVQGTIAQRLVFGSDSGVPKQSYGNVFVCQYGGFSGQLSNLRYYDYALSIFSIQNIVFWGPNFSPASNSGNGSTSNYFFMDNSWYTSRY
jgi:hypothetical protein